MFLLFNLPVEVVLIILTACSSGDLHSLSLVNRSVSHLTDERRRKLHVMCLPPFNMRAPHTRAQTCISIPGKKIGYEGIVALCGVLDSGSFRSLKVLDFKYNNIGDLGMIELSHTVANGSLGTLTQLKLGGNKIGDQGMIAFSNALDNGSMKSLQQLWLDGNAIGDAGMIAFADALKSPIGSMGNLQILGLHGNKISDDGMAAFANAIKPTLENQMRSLPACNIILVECGNPGNAAQLKVACEERGIACM